MILSKEEVDRDIELTRNDIHNLEKVCDGLSNFITMCGEESRIGFKVDLFKYKALLGDVKDLLKVIEEKRARL